MRYPPDHKAKSRARILAAAAASFRKRGFAATGVDGVMEAAGLTAGAFYGHFRSKNELLVAAIDAAAESSRERWYGRFDELRGRAWVQELLRSYLSPAHRDDVEGGCIFPSLGPEVARTSGLPRRHFEKRLRGLFALMKERAGCELAAKHRDVVAAVALCVGAVVLSRAVADRALADEILCAALEGAQRLLGL